MTDSQKIAQTLVHTVQKASLGTLDKETGAPYVSLVSIACDGAGCPLFALSELARHTKNFMENQTVSLLIDGTEGLEDPMTGPRITLSGKIMRITASKDLADCRRRFSERHPDSDVYTGFSDFSHYRLEPTSAHLISGFGRIVDLPADTFVLPKNNVRAFSNFEDDLIREFNEQHEDKIAANASARGDTTVAEDWRLVGVDPAGAILVCTTGKRVRIHFPTLVETQADCRAALTKLLY